MLVSFTILLVNVIDGKIVMLLQTTKT